MVMDTSPPNEESFSSDFFGNISSEYWQDLENDILSSSGYHCFKDLVCGNVDKESVESGWTPCGFLVNGLSISLLIICTIFKL